MFIFFAFVLVVSFNFVDGYNEQNPALLSNNHITEELLIQNENSCPSNENGICSSHGDCIEGICLCHKDYSGLLCSFQQEEIQACPHLCYGNGVCNVEKNRCECFQGYKGAYCSEYAGCREKAFCSGHGKCEETNSTCICNVGWNGQSCENQISCPNNCNGNGICVLSFSYVAGIGNITTSGCVCDSMFEGESCETVKNDRSCPLQCSGNGKCDESKRECQCFDGFVGPACNIVRNLCSLYCGNGYCVSQQNSSYCECSEGYTGEQCNELIESYNPCYNGSLCSGHGVCNSNGVCNCYSGFKGTFCDRIDETKTCKNSCSGNGRCVSLLLTNYCECDEVWGGESCEISRCPVDYLNSPCSSQGICEKIQNNKTKTTDFVCTCDVGFKGSNCNIQIVPCSQNCTPNGKCVDGKCVCATGWSGKDCSTNLNAASSSASTLCCPKNCSDNGVCDMVGCKCDCLNGWTGRSCSVYAGDDSAV